MSDTLDVKNYYLTRDIHEKNYCLTHNIGVVNYYRIRDIGVEIHCLTDDIYVENYYLKRDEKREKIIVLEMNIHVGKYYIFNKNVSCVKKIF